MIEEEGLPSQDLEVLVLHARGGGSLSPFRQFVHDAREQTNLSADLLVVGSHANCKGFKKRRDQVSRIAKNSPYEEVVTAIPDPHVERWYLLDVQALSRAAGVSISTSAPEYKCEKNRYKTLLRQAFMNTGIVPPLGGIEYGPVVARHMDLYSAGKQDHGLNDYIEKARAWLRRVKRVS